MVGVLFSAEFGIDSKYLEDNGIFDPTLDFDTPLFLDPLMLSQSRHEEFSDGAQEAVVARFTKIYNVLRVSKEPGDKPWKAAYDLFDFGEDKGLSGTCLGYATSGAAGRGFGPVKRRKSLKWAKDVIDLGVKDPELFSALSLFEEGIGADLISDMVLNIAFDCVMNFNRRVLAEIEAALGVTIPKKTYTLKRGTYQLPENPYSDQGHPIILVAADVLRDLPIVEDNVALGRVINQNADLRTDINAAIGEIWKMNDKDRREAIRKRAMASSEAFTKFLDTFKLIDKDAYDWKLDPLGLTAWVQDADKLIGKSDLTLTEKRSDNIERVNSVVTEIIQKFQQLVEDNRLYRLFYDSKQKQRNERYAQLLFLAVADIICTQNGLDLSPESDKGVGPVDFKVSDGISRVLVEIKLSTNSHLRAGYQKQVDAYVKAENAALAHYVVIDVGKLGDKFERLKIIRKTNKDFQKTRFLHLIDATDKPSASKRS